MEKHNLKNVISTRTDPARIKFRKVEIGIVTRKPLTSLVGPLGLEPRTTPL